jgi:chemotaxis protein CheD
LGQNIPVGMAEIKVSGAPTDALVALGLGSCIGVCMYDRKNRIAGMAHVMLPTSAGQATTQPGKFADTAVPALLEQMRKAGASASDILCVIGGGAEVFSFGSQNPTLAIGKRNAAAVREALREASVRLLAEDVGGNVGRTVALTVETGVVTVRPVGGTQKDLAKLG